jgi:phosphoribosyl-dephospho-CoA transferase
MEFRQFLLRGIGKVRGEWQLVTMAYNFKRLWDLKILEERGKMTSVTAFKLVIKGLFLC